MTRTRRALTLTLVLLITAAGVSACSEAETPVAPQATPQFTGAAAAGEHNQADVDFAKKLFPYTIQANILAGIGEAKSEAQPVKDFADRLGQAQSEPTARLGGWLTGWDQPVPADAAGGPLNDGDVNKLTTISPAAFDAAWLALVIKHQQASIKQLKAYQAAGQNPEVQQWVQGLQSKQQAQVKEAKQLLADAKG